MPAEKSKITDIIIFSFIILFITTLTNSLFLNQVGYYGALLFVIYKWIADKNNPFSKNGIEIPLLLFMAAELIAALLSENQGQAFQNLSKRVLLLPILYIISATVTSPKRVRTYYISFIAASMAMALAYLYLSWGYYKTGMYAIDASGPVIWHHPITISEFMSFIVIFMFAWLIDEKNSWKSKLLATGALFISLLTVLATYKRTGWIGLAAGIFLILLMKRKYIYIIPLVLAGIFLVFRTSNESCVNIYRQSENGFKFEKSIGTEGRAHHIISTGENEFILSDFEGGIKYFSSDSLKFNIPVDSPALTSFMAGDSIIITRLLDTRILIHSVRDKNYQFEREIIPPGFTSDVDYFNGLIYVADRDSGLSVYTLGGGLKYRNDKLKDIQLVRTDSSGIFLAGKGRLTFIGKGEDSLFTEAHSVETELRFADILPLNGKLLAAASDGLYLFEPGKNLFSEKKKLIGGAFNKVKKSGEQYLASGNGNIYRLIEEKEFLPEVVLTTGFTPSSITVAGENILAAKIVRNRFRSIIDPTEPSNISRFTLWSNAMKIFADYPIFGVGDIGIEHIYSRYKNEYDKEVYGHLHNNYIHLLVILGLFGFIAMMWLFAKIFLQNIKFYSELRSEPFASSIILGGAGSFAAFLVSGLTEWNIGDHEVITMVWFVVGLNYAVYKIYGK